MAPSTTDSTSVLLRKITQLLQAKQMDGVLALVAELNAERDVLATERDVLATERDVQGLALKRHQAEITRLRGLLYGRRSEKLTREELGQLVLCYGATEAEAAESDPTLPVPPLGDAEPEEALPRTKRPRRNHRGRSRLSPDLERKVTLVPVPEGERACQTCGTEMVVFGHFDHEQVEYVPAKFVVNVERREKLCCKHCKGDAVTADRVNVPDVPLRVGASVLAYLIESKCDDALPIHRQCDQFARLGFELLPSTAYGYWQYVTSLLLPLSDALLGVVLEDENWVGIDDTGLDVLDPGSKGGTYRGHLWCFRSSAALIAYQFTKTWRAEEVAPWFHAIGNKTHVQVDDYKGYCSEFRNHDGRLIPVVPPDRRLGCMMHVRRRFHQALKAGDRRAALPVKWIQDIYQIEADARGLLFPERHALRQLHSLPLLDAFDAWVDDLKPKLGKSTLLDKAINYAHHQRPFIRRCFSDGRFEIDNGAVERAIREPAIGRKNYLFTGSESAGRRLAAAYSLVQTCRAIGVPTRDYLVDVITKIERRWPARRLTELLPHRWSPGLTL